MSLWHIILFIPLLNSSTKDLSSYLLPFATLLNSYTNSSIIFPSYSSLFNSATFTPSLFSPSNSFLMSTKNFSAILYFSNLSSKSSKIFSFQISTNLSYTYDNICYICSSSTTPLIFIFIYNLHTVIKSEIFLRVLLNTCGLVTSVLASCPFLSSCITNNAWT